MNKIRAVSFITSILMANSMASNLSGEQLKMISGSVMGAGCVEVNSRSDVNRLVKEKAKLKAISSLAKSVEISGAESLKIQRNESFSQNITSSVSVVANKQPRNELYFSDVSRGYFCVVF